jgi:hypothetical protein
MSDKIDVAGDPAWVGGLGKLFSIFDPKSAAEGAALQARTRNFDAETRYNTARAAGVEDQNTALTENALRAAGYSEMEIAAMRAARSNSVADIAAGRNRFRGYDKINAPGATDNDIRLGALTLGIEKAGSKDFAGTSDRADTLNKDEYASKLAQIVAGSTLDANAKIEAAKIAAAASENAAKIRAAAGIGGKADPNTQPFVTRDPAGDVSRLFGVTKEDGTWVPPSEEDVVQPIMRRAQALIAGGYATRENAIEMAIASLGFMPKKDIVKEGNGWGSEVPVTKPRPAKALPMKDPSVNDEGMDTGEVIQLPEENFPSLKDPNGPAAQAPEGTVFVLGNIAFKRVPGGLKRIR